MIVNLSCNNCLIERVYMITIIFLTCLKNLKTLVQNRRETNLLLQLSCLRSRLRVAFS